MSDINWDEAPEWATHEGTPKGMQNNSRYWVGENNYQCRRVNGVMNTYGKEYTWYFSTFTDLTARQSKPVYTQAMCDAGTLPSVGMECQSSVGIVTVKFIGRNCFIVDDGNEEFHLTKKHCLHAFKPIDTRTDEQKLGSLISSIVSENNNLDAANKILSLITGEVLSSKYPEFNCVQFTGSKS